MVEQKHGVYKHTYFYSKDNYKSGYTYLELWNRGKLASELSYKCDSRINAISRFKDYCTIIPNMKRIIYEFNSIPDMFRYFNDTKRLVEQYNL